MAVLQKTRVEGLLTAQQGINITGGVLDAPSGTIDTLTSNDITVNSTLKIGSGTTLTSSSITTSTANFTTIDADTYAGLPVASETLQGISYLTDNYLAAQSGKAVSAVAVYNFYQSITSQMDELEDRVIGVSSDAFDKDPPTLWSVKNYADQMSITGGDILDDVLDDADMCVEKLEGRPTLNIHIKKFALQSTADKLRTDVDALSGTSGSLSALADRVATLENKLPLSSFSDTTVYDFVNNRLGWSSDETVQNKLDSLNSNLETSIKDSADIINNTVGDLSTKVETLDSRVTTVTNGVADANNTANDALMQSGNILNFLSYGFFIVEKHKTSTESGTISISLEELGLSLEDAPFFVFIVSLNGFILKGALSFPSSGDTSAADSEYIFINSGDVKTSYIRTVNSLLPNQELRVFAFGYTRESLGALAMNLSNIGLSSSQRKENIKTSSKLTW